MGGPGIIIIIIITNMTGVLSHAFLAGIPDRVEAQHASAASERNEGRRRRGREDEGR